MCMHMYSVSLQPPCNRCLRSARAGTGWERACHDCISMPYLQCRATFALPPRVLLGSYSYCLTALLSPLLPSFPRRLQIAATSGASLCLGSKFVPRLTSCCRVLYSPRARLGTSKDPLLSPIAAHMCATIPEAKHPSHHAHSIAPHGTGLVDD